MKINKLSKMKLIHVLVIGISICLTSCIKEKAIDPDPDPDPIVPTPPIVEQQAIIGEWDIVKAVAIRDDGSECGIDEMIALLTKKYNTKGISEEEKDNLSRLIDLYKSSSTSYYNNRFVFYEEGVGTLEYKNHKYTDCPTIWKQFTEYKFKLTYSPYNFTYIFRLNENKLSGYFLTQDYYPLGANVKLYIEKI